MAVSASFIPSEQSGAAGPPSYREVRNIYAVAWSQLLIFSRILVFTSMPLKGF